MILFIYKGQAYGLAWVLQDCGRVGASFNSSQGKSTPLPLQADKASV